MGVFNLLECFKKYCRKNKNIKLIHISTDEVFGDVAKGRSKETDSYNPSSPYSSSKASADHLIKAYVRTYKMNAIIDDNNIIFPYKLSEGLSKQYIALELLKNNLENNKDIIEESIKFKNELLS